MATALVIENDPTDDPRRLGEWLTEAGLELSLVRPHAGDALPADLDGYAALVVLGGDQHAYPQPDGAPGTTWFPAVEGLLRKAVRYRVPTLGVCLGAQLLATAHAGTVALSPSGPEVGPAVVGKRDAAETDPLFRYVPLIPDVLQWHTDEITELPVGATLLAASTRYPHQAFRLGDRAWGLQFHIECDTAMIAEWATDSALLAELGYDPQLVISASNAVMADVEEVWQPFAARFAALALGELDDGGARRSLPLLGH
ncbi:GMP synthase-Glutamine amidotransferase [Micromonospora phaseoli]|uniref:GMP synthase-Glutamine amidotransferase n=1 Tax=Micromonospora phaseoli TaxID=1144548 RepID=A0A1H7CB40_9ACTN|nr:type 1 glutamine amidotransferase [Micromonospora phaseoli]PZV97978.1 GMP synthase-like glutamine amidotransferase [Micromonospora phaseoli]GIJ81216.1 glutamine amidotransferase [Micromonospora phaseoli]SEJ86474.1 GMP synthase-Glutamine amidotransferase [Micromonospora phaseoli]